MSRTGLQDGDIVAFQVYAGVDQAVRELHSRSQSPRPQLRHPRGPGNAVQGILRRPGSGLPLACQAEPEHALTSARPVRAGPRQLRQGGRRQRMLTPRFACTRAGPATTGPAPPRTRPHHRRCRLISTVGESAPPPMARRIPARTTRQRPRGGNTDAHPRGSLPPHRRPWRHP